MNEKKHTPGPWVIGPDAVDEKRRQEHLIGLPRQPDGMSMTERVANYAANAHLIAAAPDMLEALEEMLAAHNISDLPTREEIDRLVRAEDAARAAIKKARGEK